MVVKMFVKFKYLSNKAPRFCILNTNQFISDTKSTLYWINEYETEYRIHRINQRRMMKWEST